ncbi:Cyanovirin-N homolog OS=Neurospora crassa (strain ATCC 24698 / 74-OR23-1A / CBS 708,71 / DSM 1257 / FGSC 987) GN=NCU05495 PE=1 SV=2 [Rhizoctonia solani AG-1 IB]|uniref:Cyanovirin-N homolog n=1 Tax=Thanatephorus cucumeris (strain AG1-IB / isolate 7/3/14) TaxID=1108050 RepID=A0A0B7FZ90_THACB|nr:Cyanovirin-N homolog OS=Neurospora crassa (strain ATCC 24698 / 74-OR23-1A / CBS 708,71 / DSM 1257 / FGSC 987) GN=NCU05495 PE=1 SV=2 [Rhizoctonia solani AG-1 IB]
MDIHQAFEPTDLDEETNDPHLQDVPESYHEQVDRLVRTYYLVVRALATGNKWGLKGYGRPKLPRELIYLVCSFAGLGLPDEEASEKSEAPIHVMSRDERRISVPWFSTAPFIREALRNIVAVQIITDSHDQGWADYPDIGWRSWFSLRIVRPDEHSLTRSVDREREWKSHSNRIADHTTRHYRGLLFDSSHEIWAHLSEGDRLEVMVHTQFRGWENYAERGILRVFTRWEPSEAFLNIVCGAPDPVYLGTAMPHDQPRPESQTSHASSAPVAATPFAASAILDSIHLHDGHILTAKLLKGDEWNDASFELDDCLGNLDGKFGWGSRGFSRSAKNIRLSVSHAPALVLLGAMLKRIDGSYDWDIINLNERITNVNGELKFIVPSQV